MPPETDWIALIVTALLSGGLATAIASIITARVAARRVNIEERAAPAQVQSILVGGAEKAVATLVIALEWAEAEIRDLKEESDASRVREQAKDARIAELETNLTMLQTRLGQLQEQVTRVQNMAQEARDDA